MQRYSETIQRESAAIDSLPLEKKREAERTSLDYQRRLVSHYYAFLAGLYRLKVIRKDVVYTYWSERDLRIIPQALIPIETSLAKELVTSPSNSSPSLRHMQRLYDDSPKERADVA